MSRPTCTVLLDNDEERCGKPAVESRGQPGKYRVWYCAEHWDEVTKIFENDN